MNASLTSLEQHERGIHIVRISGLVYLILSRSLDLAAEQEAITASERQQIIDQETR